MITYARAGEVGCVTMAAPERRNAIDPAWVTALTEAVAACAADRDARAVLIAADGPAFCVGGDLAHFTGHLDELAQQLQAMVSGFHATLRQLAELPVPVVCAAHGAVAGGALGLLWASDVVLLAPDTVLTAGFPRLGLSGDGGGSWYLPRLVGLRRALQIGMLGRTLRAEEAVEWGLADAVCAPGALREAALQRATELAAGPTAAYAEIRRLLRGAFERDLGEGLGAELEAQVRLGATADAREGFCSFVEKRPPGFTGR